MVEYPSKARRRGWEGKVITRVLIDSNGSIRKLIIESETKYEILKDAAIEAIEEYSEKYGFETAIQNDEGIMCWVTIHVNFKLNN